MMYNQKFAVALKSASGRVLREVSGDRVYLPFGAEYSVFIKNMNNRRALASVKIDGNDIGDGTTFVVPAHGHIDIERFVKSGNLDAGNRFKFIERTAAVADHRGVDAADGLVEITLQLERVPVTQFPIKPISTGGSPHIRRRRGGRQFSDNVKSANYSSSSPESFTLGDSGDDWDSGAVMDAMDLDMERGLIGSAAAPANETGVTAPGSISEQQFTTVDSFPLEPEKIVFVFQILGETEDNRHIRQPVTVRTKTRCGQCGTRSPVGTKFCPECGASLQIV